MTADRDNDGGKSTANFTFSKNRTGLFHGYLSKEVPKDGKTKYAGYANITAPKPMVRFVQLVRLCHKVNVFYELKCMGMVHGSN